MREICTSGTVRGGGGNIPTYSAHLAECAQRAAQAFLSSTTGCAYSWRSLLKLGTGGQFHLEGRALAQGRLDPDAAAVHFDDLLGDESLAQNKKLVLKTDVAKSLPIGIGVAHKIEEHLREALLVMASPRPVPPLALVLELSTWWN